MQRRPGDHSSRPPLLLGVAVAAGGCASLPPRYLPADPTARVIDHVPLRTFEEDRCGSGTLALVLNVAGDTVTEEELAASLPRERGGVLSIDLMLAARQRGFDAS